jgi:hypothetical protein
MAKAKKTSTSESLVKMLDPYKGKVFDIIM